VPLDVAIDRVRERLAAAAEETQKCEA